MQWLASMIARPLLLTAIAALLAGLTSPGSANEFFVVTTTVDEQDGSCSDGDCSLRDALQSGEEATVYVPAGTYTLDVSFFGSLEPFENTLVIGDGRDQTIIQAAASRGVADRSVFEFDLSDIVVHMIGLTIRHGNAEFDSGGAILWRGGGQLIIEDCDVTQNDAEFGGAFYLQSDDDFFALQSVVNGGGGGLTRSATLTLIDTNVSDNAATFVGGAILLDHGSGPVHLVLDGATITDNTAPEGGGIAIDDFDNGNSARFPSFVDITESVVSDNVASDGPGGGIRISTADTQVVIRGSTFERNDALLDTGGAIDATNNSLGSVTVIDSDFADNRSQHGGAIFSGSNQSFWIEGSTFTGNTAMFSGGGIYIDTGRITTLLDNVFTDNTANNGGGAYLFSAPTFVDGSLFTGNHANQQGGGIYVEVNDLQMRGSTLVGNTADVGAPACFSATQIDSLGMNTIDDIAGCGTYVEGPGDMIPEPGAVALGIAALLTLAGLARSQRRGLRPTFRETGVEIAAPPG